MTKKIKRIIIIFAAIIFFIAVLFVLSNRVIVTNNYGCDFTGSPVGAKIVLISDLHGEEFGRDNCRLIEKIAAQEPDVICLGGDFIDEDNDESENSEFLSLADELLKTAPVYYAFGNHDLSYFSSNGFDLTDKLEALGCVVLDKNYVDLEINGVKIRLGGLYDYAFNSAYLPAEEWQKGDVYTFLSDFTSTDSAKVLISHRPDGFIYGDAPEIWDIDLVLCGHTHGGLWRFPFIGGIFAPEQGFNPVYDRGEFDLNGTKMIISSGLAGYEKIPRLFNSPEITVINVK